MRRTFSTGWVICWLLLIPSLLWAGHARRDSEEDSDSDRDREEEGDDDADREKESPPMDLQKFPPDTRGSTFFPTTSFHLGFGYEGYSDPDTVDTTLIMINPGGSFGWDRVSVRADIEMDLIIQDKRNPAFKGGGSDFVFGSFGVGSSYTYYNHRPFALTAGIDFRFINQSFGDTFSMDVFHLRPFQAVGIQVSWFTFTPYVGLPVYFDTNNGNDGDAYPKRRPSNIDDFTMGIDYGIPIVLNVPRFPVALMFEPSGVTWFTPETQTYIYLTPAILYSSRYLTTGLGVRLQVHPKTRDGERMWEPVVFGGIHF